VLTAHPPAEGAQGATETNRSVRPRHESCSRQQQQEPGPSTIESTDTNMPGNDDSHSISDHSVSEFLISMEEAGSSQEAAPSMAMAAQHMPLAAPHTTMARPQGLEGVEDSRPLEFGEDHAWRQAKDNVRTAFVDAIKCRAGRPREDTQPFTEEMQSQVHDMEAALSRLDEMYKNVRPTPDYVFSERKVRVHVNCLVYVCSAKCGVMCM
jgi:hypothetical protein